MSTLPERVSTGSQLFQKYCVVCHLEQGQGSVGPNLTDRYWINGGQPVDIHRTVTEGVPAKGMAAWGGQLGPQRVEAVVAYVLTLRDTEVPGKAPEGELYTGIPTSTTDEGETPADENEAPAGQEDAPPGESEASPLAGEPSSEQGE
jgi:cytochrome c oxidase cbb3-type subunit 3